MGVYVITDDIVRHQDIPLKEVNFLAQWAFTNRILKSAKWATQQGNHVQYMQLTSFGCGPDAFLIDEIRALLKRCGKNLTLLKIDDISNTGSITTVRSLVEACISVYNKQKKNGCRNSYPPLLSPRKTGRRKLLHRSSLPLFHHLSSIMKVADMRWRRLPDQ